LEVGGWDYMDLPKREMLIVLANGLGVHEGGRKRGRQSWRERRRGRERK
jgi:hypothetical protein